MTAHEFFQWSVVVMLTLGGSLAIIHYGFFLFWRIRRGYYT